MSSRKRRLNRKIKVLVRMDQQYTSNWKKRGRPDLTFFMQMQVRGDKLVDQGYRARGLKAVKDGRAARGHYYP